MTSTEQKRPRLAPSDAYETEIIVLVGAGPYTDTSQLRKDMNELRKNVQALATDWLKQTEQKYGHPLAFEVRWRGIDGLK